MIPETICHLSTPSSWRNTRTHFYKFMTRATAEIVMRNNTLRWSTPAYLNDPHDNQFDFSTKLDHELAKQETLRKLWENHYGSAQLDLNNQLGALIHSFRGRFPRLDHDQFCAEYASAIDEIFERSPNSVGRFNDEVRIFSSTNKILCLTERIDEILMWAYYAEGQAGVALRFRSAPEIDSLWGAAAPVLYLDEPPPLYDVETFSDVMSGRASLDRRKILEQLARTKATCWSHEREWRVFAGSGRDKDAPYEDIPFLLWELDAVIVGCKMSRHDKADIASIAQKRYPHAQLYRAQPARGNFGLSFTAES